jgi:hypothetical protein
MMPALVLIEVGRRRLVPIPLPVFLLWPLVLLALVAVGLMRLVLAVIGRPPGVLGAAATGLRALFQLAGLRVDVESADGERFRIQFI